MKASQYLAMLFIIGLCSCSPKFYTPNTQNVPLISEKGETNLTLSGNGNQVEFQGAFGVSESFAIKANGGLFIPPDLENGNGGSGKFLEIGGGYYHPITSNIIFETYGIIGLGSFENHLFSNTISGDVGNISASILRVGIQPNIGYKSKYFTAGISSRIVNLNYTNIEGDLIFDNIDQKVYLEDNKFNFLVEPALTVRFGVEKVKVQLQYIHSYNLSNNSFSQDESMLTAGLNFNFR